MKKAIILVPNCARCIHSRIVMGSQAFMCYYDADKPRKIEIYGIPHWCKLEDAIAK